MRAVSLCTSQYSCTYQTVWIDHFHSPLNQTQQSPNAHIRNNDCFKPSTQSFDFRPGSHNSLSIAPPPASFPSRRFDQPPESLVGNAQTISAAAVPLSPGNGEEKAAGDKRAGNQAVEPEGRMPGRCRLRKHISFPLRDHHAYSSRAWMSPPPPPWCGPVAASWRPRWPRRDPCGRP